MVYFPTVRDGIEIPGEQGWWLPGETTRETIIAEERTLGRLQDVVPDRFTARSAKKHDEMVLRQIKDWQRQAGIEDGIDLTFIEWWVLGEGKWFDWKAQIIGSCVASGGMRAIAYRMLWEILVLGEPEDTLGDKLVTEDNIASFAPYSYRAGRREGGLNGGDGSFCGAHIQGLMKWGILACDTPGLRDYIGIPNGIAFPEPANGGTYRTLGNSNQFVDKFETEGQKLDLIESIRIRDIDTAMEELVEKFKPFMICSMWAFVPSNKVLSNGMVVYKRSGQWAHNMTICAIFKCDGAWYVKVKNSWGPKAHRNGDYFIIPIELFKQWIGSSGTVCMTIGNIEQRKHLLPDILFTAA